MFLYFFNVLWPASDVMSHFSPLLFTGKQCRAPGERLARRLAFGNCRRDFVVFSITPHFKMERLYTVCMHTQISTLEIRCIVSLPTYVTCHPVST